MSDLIQPILLYACVALGAVGVLMSLPRKGPNPQVLGALLAGAAAGIVFIVLGMNAKHAADAAPGNSVGLTNPFFYVFALLGCGSALRMITHQRPVYAAMWFIMTVLSTAGILVLLSAEFMAAALVIVYAGAILITYLFVIMLATQAPAEGEDEVLAEYDTVAREPIAATIAGFVVLAVLTTLLFRGIPKLPEATPRAVSSQLVDMPRKVDRILEAHGLLQAGDRAVMGPSGEFLTIVKADQSERVLARNEWPEDLRLTNVEQVGFNLLRDHPGSIEIAGVILLMAMLGAVVLSRKQVQIDEDRKLHESRRLSDAAERVEGAMS
ncbi:MAG: NADH-quinone oxidoreductase subunit J [Phycisphaerales bacterium]|nr:MAG: NADH-quinone oxidoreductase subunit J [Phycisphaerales bacterium]